MGRRFSNDMNAPFRPRAWRALGIVVGGTLLLGATQARAMQIFVKSPDGRTVVAEVESSDTIENVKQRIQSTTLISPDHQYLFFGGVLLQDSGTLAEYGIQKESTLPMLATWAFDRTPLPGTAWRFAVDDVTAAAGIGWTLWQSSDPLDLSGFGAGGITLDVASFAGAAAGMPTGYSPGTRYELPFLTSVGGISGFTADMITLTGAFASLSSVRQSGSSLVLAIGGSSAVPEIDPAGMGSVLALVTGAIGLLERRRLNAA